MSKHRGRSDLNVRFSRVAAPERASELLPCLPASFPPLLSTLSVRDVRLSEIVQIELVIEEICLCVVRILLCSAKRIFLQD
jgi:hypothetical protein